ncbi:MAG: HD domain-containing protein [Candidatus Gracilibacteria bacterium]|nr:HD domain-containing protein [Candidatus Gracilibacteria bacterium]
MNTTKEKMLDDAILFASMCHSGQNRATGEAYIFHPLEVVSILREFTGFPCFLDESILVKGVLHDTIESGNTNFLQLKSMYGLEIAEVILGMSKNDKKDFFHLSKKYGVWSDEKILKNFKNDCELIKIRTLHYASKYEAAAQIHPEMFIVKLADQLSNIRTCAVFPKKKYLRILQTISQIFIPIYKRNIQKIPNESLNIAFEKIFKDVCMMLAFHKRIGYEKMHDNCMKKIRMSTREK